MLINCPRCGFSQPKDHYCASCGVNIDKYVPQKSSLLDKILSSLMLQVLLVISIALGTAYLALNIKKDSPNKVLQIAHTAVHSQHQLPEISSNEVAVTVELKSETQIEKLVGSESTLAKIASTDSTDSILSKNDLAIQAITLKYSFYEVDRVLLNYWIQASSNLNPADESALFKLGELKLEQFHKQIKSEPLKTETKKINLKEKESFNAGVSRENSDSFIGFVSEFNLTNLADKQLSGFIRLMKKTRQGSELIKIPISIKKQNAFFIHLKNDMAGFENEPALIQTPPFQILKSARFLDQKTELVIIIEPFF
jgi:hypothetical protein